MTTMRKLRPYVLYAVLLAQTVPATAAAPSAQAEFRILASFYPVYIATLNIAQDVPGVHVACMASPTTGCPHEYHLRPADVVALSTASVLVMNGMGIEAFLAGATNRVPPLPVIDSNTGIAPIHNSDGSVNPHAWLSVSNAMIQARTIAAVLARLDPVHASLYATNCTRYVGSLEQLRCRADLCGRSLVRRNIVTQHDAFSYLARDLGLTVVAVIQQDHGADLSAGRMRSIATSMRAAGVAAVFSEPNVSDRAATTLARETGAAAHVLDPIVSGPAETNAYIAAMDANLATLQKALK